MGIIRILGVIAMMICHTCIYNKYKTSDTKKEKDKDKQFKKYQWIAVGFVLIPCLLFSLILTTVDISGGHELRIKDGKVFIQMNSFINEDVKNIELLDEVEIGAKIVGSDTIFASRGSYYVNGKESRVYIYDNKESCIKIELKNGKDIYYNEKDKEGTENTYNELLEYIK